jgi:hypothetical protein
LREVAHLLRDDEEVEQCTSVLLPHKDDRFDLFLGGTEGDDDAVQKIVGVSKGFWMENVSCLHGFFTHIN